MIELSRAIVCDALHFTSLTDTAQDQVELRNSLSKKPARAHCCGLLALLGLRPSLGERHAGGRGGLAPTRAARNSASCRRAALPQQSGGVRERLQPEGLKVVREGRSQLLRAARVVEVFG